MQLTADTFLEIVQSLRSDKAGGPLREQRRHPRVGVRGRASIMLNPWGPIKVVAVNVRDISGAGIGLLVPEPGLEKDDEFLLLLPQGIRHAKRAVCCTVRRMVQLSENLYSVGANFGQEIAAEQIPAMPVVSGKPPGTFTATVVNKGRTDGAGARPTNHVKPAAAATATQAKPTPAASPSTMPDPIHGADTAVISALEERLKALDVAK